MKIMIGSLVVFALMSGLSAYAEDKVDLLLGGGFIFSPEYQDFIEDTYEAAGYTDNGGMGWIDLYGGIEIRVDRQIGIIVGCDAMLNAMDATGGLLDETYANVILVPSVYGQLYFSEARTFYINGGINLPLPATGSDYFEMENNGIGFGANIGVELAEIFRIEGGITYVPVTAKATASNPVWAGEQDYNFGGVQLRAILAF